MIQKVKLVEFFKKAVKWDKKLAIYTNGIDNAYPEKSGRLINNSVTAKMSSEIMTQFLIGRGYGQAIDAFVINKEHAINVADFATEVANEITEHRGVFIHVDYEVDESGKSTPVDPKVIPFDWCRIGMKDDGGYNGKIYVNMDWRDTKSRAKAVDVYNENEAVIDAQISKAGSVGKYKGQIFYYNSDPRFHYPVSRVDSVMDDCDSEFQAALYKNQLLRKGFFGKTLIVSRPLIDDDIEEYLGEGEDKKYNPEYGAQVTEATEVREEIEKFIGADNAGGAMFMEMEFAGDKLEDALFFKNIEANIKPELFAGTEKSIRANILMAFNNLPVGLVMSSESLFGNSGESLKEMKKQYWENTTKERKKVEQIVSMFYNLVKGNENSETLNTLPIVTTEGFTEESANEARVKAQATLKGSVGGVTALLAIQQSVSEQKTDRSAAIKIIEVIYGIDAETAGEMLGTPKTEETKTD